MSSNFKPLFNLKANNIINAYILNAYILLLSQNKCLWSKKGFRMDMENIKECVIFIKIDYLILSQLF